MVVAPVVAEAVTEAVTGVQGANLGGDECLRVQVRSQTPFDTVSGSSVLPSASAPQLWVADSSLWVGQVRAWPLQLSGSFGSTPVVLVTNSQTQAAAGWASAPSWTVVMDGSRQLAAPRLSMDAAGLLAMQALWQVSGRGATGERRLAAALTAVGLDSGTDKDKDQVLRKVSQGQVPEGLGQAGVEQPFVTSTEQTMRAINQDSAAASLVAVYPVEGSPSLDFPILRVAPSLWTSTQRAAAEVVVGALTGSAGRQAARRAGLRNPEGGDPPSGVSAATVRRLGSVSEAEQAAFLSRLSALAAPTRLLAVLDVSPSMRAIVPGTKSTRLELAARACHAAGLLLGDSSSVGLWVFSQNQNGALPYHELAPVALMGDPDGKGTHRSALADQLLILDRYVAGKGTELYTSALAAVHAVRAHYDPRAENVVVILTDGRDESLEGPSLAEAARHLRAEAAAAPGRPVRLIAIAMGPSTDLLSLQTLVAPTRGAAYRADSPAQLQEVLYDALARRTVAPKRRTDGE